ncbi:ATP-binding protein [Streptomyces sp. NPDC058067]|uniref:ATP-binding protein n=1 Tax=Streptomyces sp. NPDC058067 TaxID=3346324 RepID=UPI0036E5338C
MADFASLRPPCFPFDQDGSRLVGRAAEQSIIDGLFRTAVVRGAALMLTGEAGIGKSALLDAAALRAAEAGFGVLRVGGSQFEQNVAFSALNQILRPLADRIDMLPMRQAETLRSVQGMSEGPPTELPAIANAVQDLLVRTAAERGPLALLVDDAAWLDRPSTVVLAGVARTGRSEPIALLVASRTGDESFLNGTRIPRYEVRPLDDASADELVADRFPAMAARVRRRLVSEAGGNPLALLELPVPLSDAQRQERGTLPAALSLTERLEEVFSSRVAALPEATRRLLLLAVLDGSGELHVLQRALGGREALVDLEPAERNGVIRVDARTGRLAFRHPLTRSAVMGMSTFTERQRGHRALAEHLPNGTERRARHLADAVVGPDEDVAALLQEAAYRTLRRGDAVGALTTLLRASELSASRTAQASRLAEAACLGANITGDLRNVRALLDGGDLADPAYVDSLAAATAAASHLLNGEGDVETAHRLLVGALATHGRLSVGDGTILHEALHTLLLMCFFSGRPELWRSFDDALARQSAAADPLLPVVRGAFGDPAYAASSVLDALDAHIAGLHQETDPTHVVRTAISAAYVDRLPGCRSALWHVVEDGRDGGAVTLAIQSLFLLSNDAWTSGQWDDLKKLTDEGLDWCATYDYRLLAWSGHFLKGLLAAARGDAASASRTADRLVSWGNPRGLGALRAYATHIRALSALGRADFAAAHRLLSDAVPPGGLPPHMPHALWLLLDFAEAAAHVDRHREAAAHVAAARRTDLPKISPRLAMVMDAAEAMATGDVVAHELFERAIATPGAERWPFDWARICLAYGERLRRARAGGAARVHLGAALGTFDRLGAVPWSVRAANELRASGVTVAARGPEEGPSSPLTPQERQVAWLAATGLSNKQIAEQLFLSPRTVAAHLRGVFRKVGVTSRAGLRDALTGR